MGVEEIGLENVAGGEPVAGDVGGGFHAGDGRGRGGDELPGFADGVKGAGNFEDEVVADGGESLRGGGGVELGGLPAGERLAAVIERPLGENFAVEIVGGVRVIEVAGEAEGALVERHHKRLDRVVGGGVAAGEADLRPERGFGLLDAGAGGVDVLLGGREIGIVLQRETNRRRQAELPGRVIRRRHRHNQRGQPDWNQPVHYR